MSDPALHDITVLESLSSASLRLLLAGLTQCLPDLPPTVCAQRWAMARHMIAQMCVERERALAQMTPALQPGWPDLADGLIVELAAEVCPALAIHIEH